MMKIKPIKTRKRNRRHREPLMARAGATAKKWGRVLAFALPVPVLAYGAWWAYGQVTTSQYLVVKNITVAGAERVTGEEIVSASGIIQGQNIFSFSKDEVLSRLKANPWLESAEVNRELPGTIEITVKERDAIALVKLDSL
jgi:cell division protein FtsQ